jgi:DNA-binding SARP family transcriptional activator
MQPGSSPQTPNNVLVLPRTEQARASGSFVARIHLLGTMRALTVRRGDILPRGRKARAILGYLCLSKGASIPRARLAALLWDRVPPNQARASLRQSLRELTLAFGPLADQLLMLDRDTIRFATNDCWIDAVALLSEEPETSSIRGKLAELCSGDLLEDLDGLSAAFDRWLVSTRTSLKTGLRDLLANELPRTETSSDREDIARRLIEFDPTHEGASRVLMRSLIDRKERGQALLEYQRLQAALRLAFDASPALETRALHDTIRRFGEPDPQTTDADLTEHNGVASCAHAIVSARSHRRVGVLPFLAVPSRVDDAVAFTLAQEIAAALARFQWFDVVAPTALMPAPAPTFLSDVELRRRELDYVVDGSVSCSRGTYQIKVRLLDLTTDAKPVWTSTFELPADRLDLLDEQVTAPIVAQIDPVILFMEGQAKRRNGSDDALCCVMRALPLMNTMEQPKYEQGGRLIERALALEPDNAFVLAWAAYWHVFYVGQGWAAEPQVTSATALNYAHRATQLDPRNAEALAIYGHILSFVTKHGPRAALLRPRAAGESISAVRLGL